MMPWLQVTSVEVVQRACLGGLVGEGPGGDPVGCGSPGTHKLSGDDLAVVADDLADALHRSFGAIGLEYGRHAPGA
jgi:hypothetical protein